MDTRDKNPNLCRLTFLKTTTTSIATACAVGPGCDGEMEIGEVEA